MTGNLWFNSNSHSLNVYDNNNNWLSVQDSRVDNKQDKIIITSQSQNACTNGALWFESNKKVLNIYDGGAEEWFAVRDSRVNITSAVDSTNSRLVTSSGVYNALHSTIYSALHSVDEINYQNGFKGAKMFVNQTGATPWGNDDLNNAELGDFYLMLPSEQGGGAPQLYIYVDYDREPWYEVELSV